MIAEEVWSDSSALRLHPSTLLSPVYSYSTAVVVEHRPVCGVALHVSIVLHCSSSVRCASFGKGG